MQNYLPFLNTLLAGLATGLGGLATVILRPTPRILAASAGFAGGVMLTVSLADLIPAALHYYAALYPVAGAVRAPIMLLALGMAAAVLLGSILPEEKNLAVRFAKGDTHRAAVLRTALLTALALVLHNLPEGVLTLFAGFSSPSQGVRTSLAIALHNIPEGLAVAVPFAYATRSRAKGAVAALVSGLAEPLGAALAWLLLKNALLKNAFTPTFLTGTMVWVAGIMLWVACGQLLPAALGGPHAKTGAVSLAVGCLTMLLGIAALP